MFFCGAESEAVLAGQAPGSSAKLWRLRGQGQRARSGCGSEKVAEPAHRCLWCSGSAAISAPARPAGAEVRFIARAPTYGHFASTGLRCRSVKGDFEVQAPPPMTRLTSASATSCCFVSDLRYRRCRGRLGPLVGDGTAVVSLQNGVENEEKLAGRSGKIT